MLSDEEILRKIWDVSLAYHPVSVLCEGDKAVDAVFPIEGEDVFTTREERERARQIVMELYNINHAAEPVPLAGRLDAARRTAEKQNSARRQPAAGKEKERV